MVKEVADYYLQRGTPIIGVALDCSKAFDKCLFNKLFEKLLARNVPGIVIRALVHVYEEQTACVRLLGNNSESFRVTNGTRQGSVGSPKPFAVYLDGLLLELRQLKVDPINSKSKCIFFSGKARNVVLPDPLKLNGVDLPWVASAGHLGHVLHQDCTMDQDSKVKRAKFIDKTCELRETFSFAHPEIVIKAAQVYASDAYGFMLYDLTSNTSESFFSCWNTFVKLAWNVPRSTYTFVVDNLLASHFSSLKKQILSRYTTFFQSLFTSASKEVRHLVRIVSRDAKSTVYKNVKFIENICGLSPWDHPKLKILESFPKARVPDNNEWRLPMLKKMLEIRLEKDSSMENTDDLSKMIDSLCNS